MADLHSVLQKPVELGRRGVIESIAAVHAWRAGMIGADPPRRALAVFRAIDRLGQLGGAVAIAAIRHGDQVGLIDEIGSLTFSELDARSDALACGLRARGLVEGDGIGILCRNHRGFLDITFAGSKLGARILYLNTDFAGPQLRDVCARENISLLVHDEEYDELVAPIQTRHGRLLGWTDGDPREDSLDALIAAHAGMTPPPPAQPAAVVLLTSGTTGTPKGAPRHQGRSLAPIGALLSKVPYRSRESTYVAAPMFHGLGFTQMVLSVILGCTTIVQRRFHPTAVLDAIERERPTALVVVPVMLQRIVSVLEQEPGHDTSSLRIVFCSGAQLEAELVRRAQRTIGDKLYNFYGSTEVAYATFATPEDLRAAPGTAGRVPFGAIVRLFDADGRPVSGVGQVGRIFVGNSFQFDGYTGGGNKEVIDGLMSTGDVGHFDAGDRLFIDGRDDDMIVSGGENLFPGEVEELLITHEGVEEASVIGVEDPDFGKRLAAFVVIRPGASLTADEVREFVKGNLARYKVPRDVHFIDELPRNPTGKVLKRELRERYAGA
ncbi:MAG: fatty-acyl-CoA synthase [Solirubrobacteraceae bacterium]|nr:fatty-acyl-CoA synthase [Solirubrobacteraceae bacterium]